MKCTVNNWNIVTEELCSEKVALTDKYISFYDKQEVPKI
jgi:hypothetical protein